MGSRTTQFRQLSSVQGRWLSPDPAGIAAADLTNPQSLNLYAYVNNNPMNAVDPLGLACKDAIRRGGGSCDMPGLNGGEGDEGYFGSGVTIDGVPGVGYFSGPGANSPGLLSIPIVQWVNSSSGAVVPSLDEDGNPVLDQNGNPIFALSTTTGYLQTIGSDFAVSNTANWWENFASSFVGGFSFKSARIAGETITQCVNRVQQGTIGQAGQSVLNSVTGASLIAKGISMPLGSAVATNSYMITTDQTLTIYTRALSLMDMAAGTAVRFGASSSLMRLTTAAATKLSPIAGTAVAIGGAVEGGYFLACR